MSNTVNNQKFNLNLLKTRIGAVKITKSKSINYTKSTYVKLGLKITQIAFVFFNVTNQQK